MANRVSVDGFVADFHSEESMQRILDRENVAAPDGWERSKDNFKVAHDGGRVLTLMFWDWGKDQRIGTELFDVDYDEVECWA